MVDDEDRKEGVRKARGGRSVSLRGGLSVSH